MPQQSLPFGEIRPAAQSLGAVIQPLQRSLAQPTKPSMLGQVRGITQLQTAGSSNVQGYNMLTQVAEALGPLNKALSKSLQKQLVEGARGKIEDGYMAEAKNQAAKAARIQQVRQEMGAAEAVKEIRRLEKEDPYGAELLRETNPWNAIGRRRFLAQLAGSEIKDAVGALSADSSLLQYPPGHPALAKAKMDATSQVLDKYGLQPEYLESQYYVAPEMNEAWDDFTKAHSKAYSEEMTRTNLEAGKASLLAKGKYLMGGVQLGNGVTVRKGEDGWLEAAMEQLQPQLDAVIALFPGNRKEAVKELREYLSKTLGVYAPELVSNLRGGDANLPLEERPAWGDSYQYELIEGRVAGLQDINKVDKETQTNLQATAEADYLQNVATKLPGSEEHAEAYAQWMGRHSQLRGIADLGNKLNKDMASSVEITQPKRFETAQALEYKIRNATDADYEGGLDSNVQGWIRQRTQMELDPSKRDEVVTRLQGLAATRRNDLAKRPAEMKSLISLELKQDLAQGPVKELDEDGSLRQSMILNPNAGAGAAQNVKLQRFYNDTRNLYTRVSMDALDKWRQDNDGAVASVDDINRITSGAIATARQSPEYARIYKTATGLNPGEVGAATVGPKTVGVQKIGTTNKPEPQGLSGMGALTREQARGYKVNSLITTDAIADSFKHMRAYMAAGGDSNPEAGPVVPMELLRLSQKAGVNPFHFLEAQIELYGAANGQNMVDPQGKWRNWLEQMGNAYIKSQQQEQSSVPVLTGDRPLVASAPGGWLTSMVFG